MLVKHAKAVARHWARAEAGRVPGVHGAYIAGSVNWLPDDAPLPATSDLDINLVLTGPLPPRTRGKFVYRDLLLEVTYLSVDDVRTPEMVLSHYHLAGGLRTPSILLDPSGQLAELQVAVARGFAHRHWVRARCAHARERVLEQLAAVNASDLFPEQVLGWLFPTGVLTHVLLVAGLRNPTVRGRYVAVRALLAEYGYSRVYETLVEILGCAQMSRPRAEQHLLALAAVFDAAAAAITTPFPFASDISALARPIAIDGSRELIRRGDHREAIFWMVATYSRCQQVLHHDAPAALRETFTPGYQHLLGDLGIASCADLQRRTAQVVELLPRVWHVAEHILAANPNIEG